MTDDAPTFDPHEGGALRMTADRLTPHRRWQLAAVLGLFVVAMLGPRLPALDRLAVVDETFWLGRSANFYQALVSGDFAHTYQFVHPGVTVMWFGTLGYLWADSTYPSEQGGQIDAYRPPIVETLRTLGHDPLQILVAARIVTMTADTIVLVGALWIAIRLLGLWVATLGFLLLALEPFFIAHSRLLHVDAMLSSFMLLSVVALLAYLNRGRHQRDLIISGAAAGLAWLTRSPALFLIPYTGLMLLIDGGLSWRAQRQVTRHDLRQLGQPFLLWLAAAVVVTVAVWPALWVQPIGTARSVMTGAFHAAIEGHERNTFFRGMIIANGDPGWSFYPISYLWRSTPVAPLGLVLALLGLVQPQTKLIPSSLRRPLGGLLLFALLFLAFMSLGAKKFDRYLLPSYLPLELVAAAGWCGVLRLVAHRAFPRSAIATAVAAGLLILAPAAGAITTYPYYLSYYSPVLGGPVAAEHAMLVGWGEGMDQVADFIKAQPDGAEAIVGTDAWREPLLYYLSNEVHMVLFPPNASGAQQWAHTEYFVTYITSWQRNTLAPALQRYLNQHEPVLTVTIEGLPYARVYDLRRIPLPAWYFHDSPGGTEPRSPPRRLPKLPQLCGSAGSSDCPPKRSR
jgi:hypothetical protein